jgi:formylglycine-generating enzyme required for sulfatase activity
VYVTKAATGEAIPHPLSRKTARQPLADGTTVDVPEGMVYVPAGPFMMGTDSGHPSASPAHEVDVKAFLMDKYEVTNAQYMEFIKATWRVPPKHIADNGGKIPPGRENHPVTYVNWEDAKAYCDWCGKRLPTEAEWEKAASWDALKKHRNPYPWGDNSDDDPRHPLGNWAARWGYHEQDDHGKWQIWWRQFQDGLAGKEQIKLGGATMAVGNFPGGVSPHKCYDMAGNVREWVEDWFEKYPGNTTMAAEDAKACGKKERVHRGGSWIDWHRWLTTYNRDHRFPLGSSLEAGFRCAADYPWVRPEGSSQKAEGREQKKSEWDDMYVATAATGEKIPHPLSKKTYAIEYQGQKIEVPEGMVYVPAGDFTMGQGESEHRVYLDAYFIGKYEVTNAEWKVFTELASYQPLPSHWKDGKIPAGKETHPVVYVSWEDAQKYCEFVSRLTGRHVRLPTEAQWEKAARGPEAYIYPWGNQWDKDLCNNGYLLAQFGFRPNDEGEDWNRKMAEWDKSQKGKEIIGDGGNTSPVGSFPKGKCFYGCYDMAGNAYEWCSDWYMTNYYKLSNAKKNPEGPSEEEAEEFDFSGKKMKARVFRGGSWSHNSGVCRTGARSHPRYSPSSRYGGFRVVVAAREAGGSVSPVQTGAAPGPAAPSVAESKMARFAPPPSAVGAFDNAYVTTAATGEKIPHPLSKKTYAIEYQGQKIEVPEGMVYVPAGTFTMGEGESEHRVYLDAYFIGKYEVTNAEWKVFVDLAGFEHLPPHWKDGKIPAGKENHPVVSVSWEDAQKYCEFVSRLTKRDVRLPTEAQWEKAARGPEDYKYPWGNQWDKNLCNNGWLLAQFGFRLYDEGEDWDKKYKQWSDSERGKEMIALGGNTMPVGSFPKGRCFYGCYDIAGNVYEWCGDWFKTDYYRLKDARKNPQGPSEEQAEECDFTGKKMKARVLRGGSWHDGSGPCRTVNRVRYYPSYRVYGFRVVVVPTR